MKTVSKYSLQYLKSLFIFIKMSIKKFILILLLTFALNLGVQNTRALTETQRHIIENILEQNYSKDNEEFIQEVEKKKFYEMVKLYMNVLQTNKRSKFYNTS